MIRARTSFFAAGLLLTATVTDAQGLPDHVRTTSPELAAAVTSGMENSATFRQLVDRVGALNGIVMLIGRPIVQNSANRVLDGALQHRITIAGRYRIVYINVVPSTGTRPIVTIAHELQHAIEVLESGATTEAEIERLFQRIGVPVGAWMTETDAAIIAQQTVAQELSSAGRSR